MKRSLEYIEKVVCAGECIEPDRLHQLRTNNRMEKRYITDTIQMIMTLALEFENAQLPTEKYFNRGHPCAINSRNAISAMCQIYKDWALKMDIYRNILRSNITYEAWELETRVTRLRLEVNELQTELNNIPI